MTLGIVYDVLMTGSREEGKYQSRTPSKLLRSYKDDTQVTKSQVKV